MQINPNFSNVPLFQALKRQSNDLLTDGVPTEAFTGFVSTALQHETFTSGAPDPKLGQFTQSISSLSQSLTSERSREYLLRCALKVMEKGIPGHVGVAIAKCANIAIQNSGANAAVFAGQAVDQIASTKEEGVMPEMILLQGALKNESLPASVRDKIAEKGIDSLARSENWNIV